MKTQKNNRLDFRKHTIVELNDKQMNEVSGGTATDILSVFLFSVTVISIIVSAATQTGDNDIV